MEPLSAEQMCRDAERATGLSDWGGDAFRGPFDQLIRALNEEASLHEQGRQRVVQWLGLRLEQRLKLFEDRKRIPAIAQQAIERPVFVAGLPRAGTTLLHSLLATDPANIAPLHWQMLMPSPPPNDPTIDHGPARALMAQLFDDQGWTSPAIKPIHEYNPLGAEECSTLFEMSFINTNFIGYWQIPSYLQVLAGGFVPAYEMHRKGLQALQYGTQGRRWVLKAPEHTMHLSDLLTVYPDARLVQHHRDPAKSMASTLSVLTAQFPLYSARTAHKVDPAAARGLLQMYAGALEHIISRRQEPALGQAFTDVHYLELERDPIGVLKRVYRDTGLAWSDSVQQGITAWLQANRKGKHGAHRYNIADYGMTREEVWELFAPYIRHFDIELER